MFRASSLILCCALAPFAAAAEAAPGSSVFPAVRGVLDHLPGVSGAVSRLVPERSDDAEETGLLLPFFEGDSDEEPAELVQVRLSHAFLKDFLERDFNRQSRVRESILGTSVAGTARTEGTTSLVLHPNQNEAVIEVVLKGTVQARTIGHNGPVQLHCSSHSPFQSRKIIHLTSNGIKPMPATSIARTHSTTHHIHSSLPGLRGRIAERIARGRVQQVRGQADAIASRNTERRLNAEFDQTVEKSLADARGAVQDKLVSLPIGKLSDDWRYRSQPEYLEMTLRNPDFSGTADSNVATFNSEAAVAVRVHRHAVRGALTNSELRDALQPLLVSVLQSKEREEPNLRSENSIHSIKATAVATTLPTFRVSWSQDRAWLEFHFTPDSKPTDQRTALESGATKFAAAE